MVSWRMGLMVLLVVLAMAFPVDAEAQVRLPGAPERERQEALLPDAGVVEISAELRQRLGLFPEIPGFRVARLFLRDRGDAVLEIEWVEAGAVVRDRRLLDASALEALRRGLAAEVELAGLRALESREGRGGLVLGHTLLGLGYHGWAVPVALDVSSSQGAVAAYLLTAGASFYVPYALTRGRGVTETHRGLSLYGGTRGILTGVLLGDVVAGDRDHGGGSNRARLAGGVVGGALAGTLGFVAVDRWRPPPGDAELWGAFGDGGFLAGAAVAYLAGPYRDHEVERREGDLVLIETRTRNRRLGHAVTVAGHGAGLATGYWLAGRRSYSSGDVSVLRSVAVLGIQSGATVARLGGADDGIPYVAGMLAGGVAGTVAGDRWVGARGLGVGEGLLVNAGHLAGSATALGITYLVVDQVDGNETALLTASTLGGFLGAGLVWRAVADDAPRRDAGAAGRAATSGRPGDGVRVELHSLGVLTGVLGGNASGDASPWLTIRF